MSFSLEECDRDGNKGKAPQHSGDWNAHYKIGNCSGNLFSGGQVPGREWDRVLFPACSPVVYSGISFQHEKECSSEDDRNGDRGSIRTALSVVLSVLLKNMRMWHG